MSEDDWLMLFVMAVSYASGLHLGWVLWRRPQLKYKTGETD